VRVPTQGRWEGHGRVWRRGVRGTQAGALKVKVNFVLLRSAQSPFLKTTQSLFFFAAFGEASPNSV